MDNGHPINGFSIFTLIVFFAVNAVVIFPLHIPIPKPLTRIALKAAVKARIINPPGEGEGEEGEGTNKRSDSPPPVKKGTGQQGAVVAAPGVRQGSQSEPGIEDGNGNGNGAAHGTTITPSTSTSHPSSPSTPSLHFPIDLSTAPVIGVILLLATTSIDRTVLVDGIVGNQGVRPYDIMTLFISLAYISLSLDCTGLLRFMAFWVAVKGGTSGRRLYLFFYLFFFAFGTLVGNDPIILSGTSFLAYFSRIAGISPPTAWIFMQFASCNVASAVLVSSNPTNLVLTGAYEISFLVYSAWLVLPVVATAVVLFPLLLWGVFRDEELIPRKLIAPDVEPKTALIDKRGAIFGSVLLGITLVALVTLSAVGLLEGVEGVWTVTAPAALVMVGRDIWHDLHRNVWASSGQPEGTTSPNSGKREDLVEETTEGIEMQGMDDLAGAKGIAENGKANGKMGRGMRRRTVSDLGKAAGGTLSGGSKAVPVTPSTNTSQLALVPSAQPSSAPTPLPPNPLNTNTNTGLTCTSSPNRPRYRTLQSLLKSFSVRFPTFTHIFVRLPLPLLPFAFSMFILVEALGFVGWIRIFGGWWSAWVKVGGVAGAIWLMGVLSVLGCNAFGTNIGATILLSRVLQQWSQNTPDVSNRILYGSIFTLALGSNYGAFSYTFSASLAGLLWKTILLQKGIKVGRWEFLRNNWIIVIVCMIVGCLVIAGEVCVMYDS